MHVEGCCQHACMHVHVRGYGQWIIGASAHGCVSEWMQRAVPGGPGIECQEMRRWLLGTRVSCCADHQSPYSSMAVMSADTMAEEQVAALAQQMCSTCFSSTLLALPDDLLTLCLLKLDSIRDLANVGATCKRLAQFALHSGPIWAPRCSTYVDTPSAWLAASLSVHGDMQSHQSCAGLIDRTPTSFRALFRLLCSLQPMVGFWRGVGDAPRGSVYHVSWGADCIQVQQLQCNDSTNSIQLSPVLCLGPGFPLHTAELLGDTHMVVRQFRGQPRLPCAAAAAAAAVSAGGAFLPRKTRSRNELQVPNHSPARTPSPGALNSRTRSASSGVGADQHTSPNSSTRSQEHEHLNHVPGGFGHEVLKYMASQVAPPRGAARRRAAREAARAALAVSAATVPMAVGVVAVQGAAAVVSAAETASEPAEIAVGSSITNGVESSSRAHAAGSSLGSSSSSSSSRAAVQASSSSPAHSSGLVHNSHMAVGVGQAHLQPLDTKSMQSDDGTSSALVPGDDVLLSIGSPGGLTHLASADKYSQGSIPPVTAAAAVAATATATAIAATAAAAATSAGGSALQSRPVVPQAQLEPVGPNVRTHHFVRMPVPQATRAHPLAGLWKGVYGPHGLEITCVTYDFSASQARVLGWKATGDHNVPAGQDTWWASAAPQPQPWSDHELRLQEARTWLSDVPAAQPMWPDHPPPPHAPVHVQQQHPAVEQQEPGPPLPKVVSSHIGCGRIAGHHYSNPQWVPGRLWVYDNGNIAFLYMWPGSEEEPMFMVDYTRVVV